MAILAPMHRLRGQAGVADAGNPIGQAFGDGPAFLPPESRNYKPVLPVARRLRPEVGMVFLNWAMSENGQRKFSSHTALVAMRPGRSDGVPGRFSGIQPGRICPLA